MSGNGEAAQVGTTDTGRIFAGRWTARSDDPFLVLLIGFRINNFWALRKWMRTGYAMFPMVRELRANPALGLLGVEVFLYWRGLALAQYWRSYEHMHDYARLKGGLHPAAWKAYNRGVGADSSVGVWHETYLVNPGQYENVYANMPRFGLAAALPTTPATGRLETASGRMGRDSEPLYPSPATPGAQDPETKDAPAAPAS